MGLRALALCTVVAFLPLVSHAGVRRFTYVYEATTGRAGSFDLENSITFEGATPNDHSFRQFGFRHEVEYGVTDQLQASIYLADWQHERGQGTRYTDSALELIYNLSNPVADPLGLAVYQEYQVGRRLFEWESKFMAQKNFGSFIAAYNATLEAEWESVGLAEHNGEFQQSLGLSYEVSPRLAFGVECVHEVDLPGWERGRSIVFAGPNICVRKHNIWATVTALGQVTHAGAEPEVQVRAIFGVMF